MWFRTSLMALALMGAASSTISAQNHAETDSWHVITPSSPLYTIATQDYAGAGIVQADGPDAFLLLGQSGDGGVVTIELAGLNWSEGFTSTLRTDRGTELDREIPLEDMVLNTNGTGQPQSASFAVAEQDLENFMHAEIWRVSDGAKTHEFRLKGSRKAITAALKSRATN